VVETGYAEAAQSFYSGLTGMMLTGPNAIGIIYAQNPELRGKIGSVKTPKDVNYASTLVLDGYAVNAKSKNKDAAARWMKFLYNDENTLTFITVTSRIPVKKSLTSMPALNTPAYKGFIESLEYCYPSPLYAGSSEINDIIGEAYQDTIANGMSIDAAADRAYQKALAVLARYK
jgi:multiple sugar transport system substrate-binding protein